MFQPDYNAQVEGILSTRDNFRLCPGHLNLSMQTEISGIKNILAYEQAFIVSQSVCTFFLPEGKYGACSNTSRGEVCRGSGTDNKELKHHRFLMSKRQPVVNSSYSCCSVNLFGDDSRKLTALIPAVQYTFLVSTVQFKMLKRRTYSRCINVKARQSQFYSPSGCRPLLKNVSA